MNNPEEDKTFRLASALLDAAAFMKVFENMSPSGAKMSAVVMLGKNSDGATHATGCGFCVK